MSALHLHFSGTPKRPRLLWLHGFLGDGCDGTALLAPWADHFEICCPDLPGHGQSPLLSLSDTLHQIAGLAASSTLAIGYSMGGRLLMMSAARHPGNFQKLVIESAHTGLANPADRAARRAVDAERAARLRRQGLTAFVEDWYAQPLWATLSAPPARRGDPETLAAALETFSTGNQPDLRPWLARCNSPILWLAGAADPAYKEQAHWVDTHISRARVVVVPGCGHNIHLEAPDLWRKHVMDFLTQEQQREQ